MAIFLFMMESADIHNYGNADDDDDNDYNDENLGNDDDAQGIVRSVNQLLRAVPQSSHTQTQANQAIFFSIGVFKSPTSKIL